MLTLLLLWLAFSTPLAFIPAACFAFSERDARHYDDPSASAEGSDRS
jgi:hypothetical protein